MNHDENKTQNIKAPHNDLEHLKKYFSHCFDKNGIFNLEKFKNNLSQNEINFSTESYGLEWLGKSYSRLLASDPTTTLLKEDEAHNSKPENIHSQNVLIKGDNLEVLKHLANAYHEKVKMIYIDPPYNTGSDGFVYQDDRKFTVAELQKLAGIDEEKAKRILAFTQSKSNSHSAWLTFMYPRLYIAKQLLKEDGVIFISIDDNEVAQLRLLCDEIFGEENFVAELVFQTNSIKNNAKYISITHEYTIVYVKNIIYQEKWRIILPGSQELFKYFNSLPEGISNDAKSQLVKKFIKKNNIKGSLENYTYVENNKLFRLDNIGGVKNGNTETKILHPITKKECKISSGGWRFNNETITNLLNNNLIYFGNDENIVPQVKRFLNEEHESVFNSVIYKDTSQDAKLVGKLFNTKVLFEFPKNIEYIKSLLQISTNPPSQCDIILDFFAGSGTTGDAVMQLNAQEALTGLAPGNRKFILVQIAEPIDSQKNKPAYDFVKDELKAEPTIFEITKERLIRAAKKINGTLDEKINKLEDEIKKLEGQIQTSEIIETVQNLKDEIKNNLELKNQNTFKVFETIPIWDDYNFEAEQLENESKVFDENKLTADDIKALLTTWKTYDGIPLTQSLETIPLTVSITETNTLDSYLTYYGNGRLYLMHQNFKTEHLKALLEKIDFNTQFTPTSIIAFAYNFESKNLRELAENVKSYANKKNIDIDFIIRY